MAKRIIDIVVDKSVSMSRNKAETGQNGTMAIAAMKGGIRSAEWRAYMMQFLEQNPPGTPVEPAQLERLLATDGTLGDPVLDRCRGYLVGNAMCTPDTPTDLPNTVATIDDGLPTVGQFLFNADPRGARQQRRPKNYRGKKKS